MKLKDTAFNIGEIRSGIGIYDPVSLYYIVTYFHLQRMKQESFSNISKRWEHIKAKFQTLIIDTDTDVDIDIILMRSFFSFDALDFNNV